MKSPKLEENITKSITSVRWNFTMEKAWKLMQERNIRHLPVRDQTGTLVGLLSDHDVSRAMDPVDQSFEDGVIVAEYMTQPVITVEQNTPVSTVTKIMIEGKISSLLITKSDEVVGIVTSEDLLKLLWSMLQNDEKKDQLALSAIKYEPIWREVIREANAVGI
jgi:CBS domain-containing protein